MLPDRVFYPLVALSAVLMIALASVYPQGHGARSPKPFGHTTWNQLHPLKIPKPGEPDSTKAKLKGAF